MLFEHSNLLALIIHSTPKGRLLFYGLLSILFVFLKQEFRLSNIHAIRTVHLFVALTYAFASISSLLFVYLCTQPILVFLSTTYLLCSFSLLYISLYGGSLLFLFTVLLCTAFCLGALKPFLDQSTSCVALLGPFHKVFYLLISAGVYLSIFWAPLLADFNCFNKNTCFSLTFSMSSSILLVSVMLYLSGIKYFRANPYTYTVDMRLIKYILEDLKTRIFKKYKKDAIDPFICDKNEENICMHNARTTMTMAAPINMDDSGILMHEDVKKLVKAFWKSLPMALFWSLYDQQNTCWAEQAMRMAPTFMNSLKAAQLELPIINSFIVIMATPLLTWLILPARRFFTFEISCHKKVGLAMLFASFAYFIAAFMEFNVKRAAAKLSVFYQIPQYLLLSLSEFVFSKYGLIVLEEQLTGPLQGYSTALWLLFIALGNLFVLFFAAISTVLSRICIPFGGATYYMLFGISGMFCSYALYSL
ncbi:solute carrier family 15 (oligopeptide transporter), member 1 [Enteropsectra breve]|nr:solute carrier family 15 (oligopeptide transporter), member 1 [Enteropsectra breve]